MAFTDLSIGLSHPIVASFNPSLNLIRRTIRIELARVLGLGASRLGFISIMMRVVPTGGDMNKLVGIIEGRMTISQALSKGFPSFSKERERKSEMESE